VARVIRVRYQRRKWSQVPLESTREALRKATAKPQEVTTERDRLQNEMNALHREANKRGLIDRDLVAVIRKGWEDADRAAQLEIELRNEIKNHGDMRNEAQALRAEVLAIGEERHRLQNEIARLNAKMGPLEKLYEVVKKHVDHGAIIDNRADIYDAVAETAKALSQLTA
jgi:peptidoglycan hydrolase CwlO-like protein